MVNLKDVVTTILNDMASARVETDIESLRMAEVYSKDDLLKNMPIPRMRIKNFTLTLPIAIDKVDERHLADARKPFTINDVNNTAYKTLTTVLAQNGIKLSRTDIQNVKSSLKDRIEKLAKNKSWMMTQAKPLSDEITMTVDPFIQKASAQHLNVNDIKKSSREFRAELRTSLLSIRPPLPNLDVLINTTSLQNISEKEKLVHITLNVDETGLEWAVYESGTGETRERLVPE